MNNYDKKDLTIMLENLIDKSEEVKTRINVILQSFPKIDDEIINKEMFYTTRRNLDIFINNTIKDYEKL